MSDNITLPREVVEKAIKAFENGCPPTCENGMIDSGGFHPWGEPMLDICPACLAFEHLRTHLASPRPEPVAYFDLQKQVFFWAKPTMIDVPMTVALNPLPLYAAPPEAAPSEDIETLRRDAFRKGFYAGFAATGEGWNGEYPFQDMNRPIVGNPSVEAAIDEAMQEDKT